MTDNELSRATKAVQRCDDQVASYEWGAAADDAWVAEMRRVMACDDYDQGGRAFSETSIKGIERRRDGYLKRAGELRQKVAEIRQHIRELRPAGGKAAALGAARPPVSAEMRRRAQAVRGVLSDLLENIEGAGHTMTR
jgi:hypothetical protein